MGRHRWTNRLTVEQCLSLDVTRMQRDGVFASPHGRGWTISWPRDFGRPGAVLGLAVVRSKDLGLGLITSPDFAETKAKDSAVKLSGNYFIPVTTTNPHLGGKRPWFLCPIDYYNKRHDRRVRKLYLPPGETVFGCRRCHNLTYQSARRHDKFVYALARNPEKLIVELRSFDLKRGLRACDAFTILLRWSRNRSKHLWKVAI